MDPTFKPIVLNRIVDTICARIFFHKLLTFTML
ncbi:hypothetical protein X768_17705 [Mesorhizobium sp. LSJC265A00]|nr:hypothetical protein X768_17705 [Mesorhizobium sp. LSJC265A00]